MSISVSLTLTDAGIHTLALSLAPQLTPIISLDDCILSYLYALQVFSHHVCQAQPYAR